MKTDVGRMQPTKTIATKAVSGIKGDKTRLSILVCANADGSDKRDLFFYRPPSSSTVLPEANRGAVGFEVWLEQKRLDVR